MFCEPLEHSIPGLAWAPASFCDESNLLLKPKLTYHYGDTLHSFRVILGHENLKLANAGFKPWAAIWWRNKC